MKTFYPDNRRRYLNAIGNKGFQGEEIELLAGVHGAINLRNAQREKSVLRNKGKVMIIENHPGKMGLVIANTDQETFVHGFGDDEHFYGIQILGSWGIAFVGNGSVYVNRVRLNGNNNGFAGVMAKSDNRSEVKVDVISIVDVLAQHFIGEGIYIGQSTSDPTKYHRINTVEIARFIGTDNWRENAQLRHINHLEIDTVMSLRGGLGNKFDQNFNWQIIDSYGIMQNGVFIHDMPSQVWNVHTTGFTFKKNVVVGNPKCERLGYFGQNIALEKDDRIDQNKAYNPIVIDELFALNFNEQKALLKCANTQVPIIIKELVTEKNYPIYEKVTEDVNIQVLNHTVKEDLPFPKISNHSPDLLDDDCFYAKMGIGLDEHYWVKPGKETFPVIDIENEPDISQQDTAFLLERIAQLDQESQVLKRILNLSNQLSTDGEPGGGPDEQPPED